MDMSKLQKVHTKKIDSYQTWLEKHCRLRHYFFQIRKCDDLDCCPPPPPKLSKEELNWLPDPVLDETGEHYLPYSSVKNLNTTDQDRPSLKASGTRSDAESGNATKQGPSQDVSKKSAGNAIRPPAKPAFIPKEKDLYGDLHNASLYTAQNARFTVTCVECRKPRIVYSKSRLTDRRFQVAVLIITPTTWKCASVSAADMSKAS